MQQVKSINGCSEEKIKREVLQYAELKSPIVRSGFIFTDRELTKKLYPEYFII